MCVYLCVLTKSLILPYIGTFSLHKAYFYLWPDSLPPVTKKIKTATILGFKV